MSVILIGVLGIAVLLALLMLRTPVAFAMLVVGFAGIWLIRGFNSAGAVLVTETFSTITNEPLIVVPMFILLGNVASVAGFSRGLYDAAYAWIGRFRGGLASASVLGCATFSAVSGSSVATAITIGRVALPEMRRFGYSPALATGAVAAGGTLGFLIPPSTGFVIYAILTEQSIGRLFMAGILPGILLTLLFVATIWIIASLNPDAGPRGKKVSLRERLRSSSESAPLLAVIFLSIGGIYLGVFTPVEASAVGAALTIAIAFGMRAIDLQGLWTAVQDTVRTSAMLYMIVVGANVLNPFLAMTQIPQAFGGMLGEIGLGAYGTLAVILLAYIVLGMFLDGLAMLVITVPIFFPVIMMLGFDPIWFGVLTVIVIEMGMITPPVGLNVFVVKSVAGDVPIGTIYRGVSPFIVALAVCLLLIILFPDIALLIPNSMFG